MRELVDAHQMRAIEQHIMEDIGIPAIVLMERAALFTVSCIEHACNKQLNSQTSALIACGMGNNGADGLALARMLLEKECKVSVVLVGNKEKRSDLNHSQYNMLKKMMATSNLEMLSIDDLQNRLSQNGCYYDVIVDALLGIGISREVSGDFKTCIQLLNKLKGYKIAMDMPSGIHTDNGYKLGSCFMADETATFGRVKQGLLLMDGKLAAGTVLYDSCGMYDPGIWHGCVWQPDTADLMHWLLRNKNGNKSDFGKLAMIVGSKEVPGAALLSIGAAFRSGAGYLMVCSHEDNKELILAQNPECVLALYQNSDSTDAACKKDDLLAIMQNTMKEQLTRVLNFASVIAIGCGVGVDRAGAILCDMAQRLGQEEIKCHTLVLDADAITYLANNEQLLRIFTDHHIQVIMTPHMKEFSRIRKKSIEEIQRDRINIATDFAIKHNVTLVLKDAQTVVASPDVKLNQIYLNTYGNDGMAVAGSGDVLCGIIASLAGQIDSATRAAIAGVMLHALAGDKASAKLGRHSMLPQDIINMLPEVMLEMKE